MTSPDSDHKDKDSWPKALLFDLDGTLIDSVPDLTTAINLLLATEKISALAEDDVRKMIGNGIAKLVERAFAARAITLEGDPLTAMTARMMEFYEDHLVEETCLLEGSAEILKQFADAGIKIAVITNKPEGFSRQILDHFGIGEFVDLVVGGDTGPVRKPAPDMLNHALRSLGVLPSDAIMIGDSPADIGAAKAASVLSVAVHGGYSTIAVEDLGADIVIKDLWQLPAAISKLSEQV